jgi:hypothetical protein
MHYKVPTGLIPIGFVPMNQTAPKGKNPQDFNPIEILSKSFESKEALVGKTARIYMNFAR